MIGAMTLFLATTIAQDYRFPIERPGAAATQPYITAYRDHDGGGGLEDWNCGNNTYNGHRGTDIGIGGFAVMDAGSRWIVAAADGEVSSANDGCFDRCTSGACDCGGGFGNYVRVTHADGKRTYYGHMMEGSVQVSVGDRVTCGQRLGKVASSGSSTGPHLHFEPRYADNTSDDPFGGPCGGPLSYWVSQGAYNDLPEELCDGAMQPPPPPPPPDERGTIKGVLWDRSVTASPNDAGNVRVPGAMISVEGTMEVTTARAGDAFWTFTLAPGNYRLAVSAGGFEDGYRDVTVTAGQESWASIGLMREGPEVPPPEKPVPGELDPEDPRLGEVLPAGSIEQPPPAETRTSNETGGNEALEGGCACLVPRTGERTVSLLLLPAALLLLRRRRSV